MSGRHAITTMGVRPPTPQQTYRQKVASRFQRRLVAIPKVVFWSTAILVPLIGIIGSMIQKHLHNSSYHWIGGDYGYRYDYATHYGKLWGAAFLAVFLGSLVLATVWAFWMLLLEAFPTAAALTASFGAGRNLAEGNLLRAGADGYGAAHFAKMAAEKRGEEWVGGITPGAGATATPEALVGAAGLVAGMAHNHRETMDALKDLKGQ